MRGIEPRAFHMQSERSTTELHPLVYDTSTNWWSVFKECIRFEFVVQAGICHL